MHPRTWLALLTLPLVGAFTVPLLQRNGPPPAAEAKAPQDPLAGLSDIQDVLALVRDNYVDPPDLEKVLGGGIQGALERAHPLNTYLSPEDLRLPDPGSAETGLRLLKRGIYAQVVGVVPGSPAHRAGIQVGDVVRKLEGESIGPLGSWHLERRLRGPEGSELAIHRYAASSAQVSRVVLKRVGPSRPSLTLRREGGDLIVGLPDLGEGRAAEVASALSTQGAGARLVLDLRGCHGGSYAEAGKVAGLLLGPGPFATRQEAGQPDQVVSREGTRHPGLGALVALQAAGTSGPAEAVVAVLRKAGVPTVGERTAGLAVARTRIPLRQGGAVELVTQRWVGAGDEKLDRQGVVPELQIRGLQNEADPLPKVREALEKRATGSQKPTDKSARLLPVASHRPAMGREVA